MSRSVVRLALLLALLLPGSATATPCAGLQAAVSVPGATVTLDDSTCAVSTLTLADNVTLQGSGDGSTLTQGGLGGRMVVGNNVHNVVLKNLDIVGDGASGGVSFTGNSTPTIDDVHFTDNQGGGAGGGGLAIISVAPSGTISITNSSFGEPTGTHINLANGLGGGAYVNASGGANVSLSNSFFFYNDSATTPQVGGGGAYINGAQVTVDHNVFSNNELTPSNSTNSAEGGGLYARASAGITVTANTITNNQINPRPDSGSVAMHGGGGYVMGTATLSRNLWAQNTFRTHGSLEALGVGLLLASPGPPSCGVPTTMTVAGDAFLSNRFEESSTGANRGAALYLLHCTAPLTLNATNISVISNQALVCGTYCTPGIEALPSDTININNSIIWNNTPGAEVAIVVPTVGYSDFCNGAAPFAGTGNICADPQLSGTTETATSPTIDKGSNALVPNILTLDLAGGSRLLDGDGDCNTVVDLGADERPGPVVDCSPPATPPASNPPATPPADDTPPPVVTPPLTNPGQVLLCAGNKVTLLDLRRSGRFELVSGLALTSLAGKRVTITGDHRGGKRSAKVSKDGSFSARFPVPKSNQTSYTAAYGKSRSSPLKLTRNLDVVAAKTTAAGLRITARHSKGKRVKGQKASVLRQTGCTSKKVVGTATFDKHGEVTVVLAKPTPPDTIAVYRITTKTNNTFTLPIVVRR